MATVALSAAAAGCSSGGSDGTGTAGSGTAGGGGGGSSAACSLDDVNKLVTTTSTNLSKGCTVVSACHDAAGTAAGLDLASVGWQLKLVGKGPVVGAGGSSTPSMCTGKGYVYLTAGTKPASGLFIDKINPAATAPCGSHMPNLGVNLSQSDFACFQSYLTTLTSP